MAVEEWSLTELPYDGQIDVTENSIIRQLSPWLLLLHLPHQFLQPFDMPAEFKVTHTPHAEILEDDQ